MKKRRESSALEQRATALVAGAKTRAKERGLPFDLDAHHILTKIKTGLCEVTGLAFDLTGRRATRSTHVSQWAPSLDRRVPELGYTKGNVRVVVWCYNAAKGEGTDEDVLRLASALTQSTPTQRDT